MTLPWLKPAVIGPSPRCGEPFRRTSKPEKEIVIKEMWMFASYFSMLTIIGTDSIYHYTGNISSRKYLRYISITIGIVMSATDSDF